ncbi:PTS sugar transporter subunit IIA [Ligilactobacillus sp. WILCCON 0076]|uniref:PTS sugar transporter subunit IIA n=1 Tax=Ligilactobacillus ubinensis TaxID=2876789 RepID=A0A9X2FLB7_9LACO|nr:PTS sugar transporter subunit IIA [Ligilactobacillus ubinensis]MCP0886643.1 PTS sugar transporter subunit IIA [Ligilactobacillus ubinensis]
MTNIFTRENIFLNEDLNSKDEVLLFLSKKAEQLAIVDDYSKVYKAFNNRELESSTGMQDGIAMPHALNDSVKHASIIYIKLKNKLNDWDTFDETKVNKIIAMLVPVNGEKEHLQILAEFAVSLINEEKRQRLERCATIDEVYNFLNLNNVEG